MGLTLLAAVVDLPLATQGATVVVVEHKAASPPEQAITAVVVGDHPKEAAQQAAPATA